MGEQIGRFAIRHFLKPKERIVMTNGDRTSVSKSSYARRCTPPVTDRTDLTFY